MTPGRAPAIGERDVRALAEVRAQLAEIDRRSRPARAGRAVAGGLVVIAVVVGVAALVLDLLALLLICTALVVAGIVLWRRVGPALAKAEAEREARRTALRRP